MVRNCLMAGVFCSRDIGTVAQGKPPLDRPLQIVRRSEDVGTTLAAPRERVRALAEMLLRTRLNLPVSWPDRENLSSSQGNLGMR